MNDKEKNFASSFGYIGKTEKYQGTAIDWMEEGATASVSTSPTLSDAFNRAHVLSLALSLALISWTGDRFEWPIALLLHKLETRMATSNSDLTDMFGSTDRVVCWDDPMYLNSMPYVEVATKKLMYQTNLDLWFWTGKRNQIVGLRKSSKKSLKFYCAVIPATPHQQVSWWDQMIRIDIYHWSCSLDAAAVLWTISAYCWAIIDPKG